MSAELIKHIIWLMVINTVLVIAGYPIVKRKAILLGWILLTVSVVLAYIVFKNENPILKMLAIIATTFTAMKLIAAPLSYKAQPVKLSFVQWAAFAIGWVGMKPQPFETLGGKAVPGAVSFIRFGLSRLLIGALLIALVHWLVKQPLNPTLLFVLITAILLVALSLILHFGLLSISAGMWRLQGANTYLLFREPAKAKSITEFWGKRWNLAFIEMISVAIYRPVKAKWGSTAALAAAFLFSGLLHELALSLPVNSGYGLPMLYFIIQAGVVLMEKLLQQKGFTLLQNKIAAKLWLFFWLVAPMPLLFHAEFVRQIVWGLAGL